MSPDKDEELSKKYPRIFKQCLSENQISSCGFGIDTGDGWYDLIDVLCSQIQRHVDQVISIQRHSLKNGSIKEEDVVPEDDLQVVALQVKEKFGGLCFYAHGCDDSVRGMIDMAESMSFRVCEECGRRGRTRDGSWIHTHCDLCHDAYQRRLSESWKGMETK
jgi:hypothetical protein